MKLHGQCKWTVDVVAVRTAELFLPVLSLLQQAVTIPSPRNADLDQSGFHGLLGTSLSRAAFSVSGPSTAGCWQQSRHPDQIVGGRCEVKSKATRLWPRNFVVAIPATVFAQPVQRS